MAHNVEGIRRLGGLIETAQMWVRFCVGTSEATDLAKLNPVGGAPSPPERIPAVKRWFGKFLFILHYYTNVPHSLKQIRL